ncbi:baseplate tail tube initiator [Rhizobium phage P9VFCI]|uniref:Baseplate tail tube initiator n=3 Tax=Innesvirus TaxID=3044739 RepID=A0A7G7WXB2_9CAUD|nr:tail tube protein [Rhizobium phage vB_RleM_P10VF]YP_010662059.1 tail tube protein [Rhizobium phage P9VFCI]YP_010662311.1 tail tube protein [Rhizobium phage AF3]AIK68340.1 putative baseplate tail tube initiator [Rhizobium phage vB_RleM_P10VF]QNH71437.1 baseplate tail tube initiator [Rhizobium phage AF3]QNH71856.1 baseplate tail tube initiator [Rhizobium phage P9VFCI]
MNDDMMALLVSSGGFSRTNNFKVEISPPRLLNAYQQDLEMMSLSCAATEIPGIGIDTFRISNGPSLEPEQASTSYQSDIDLLFYVSKSYVERLFFGDWKNLAVDDVTRQVGFYDDYIGDLYIYPMKRSFDFEARKLIGVKLNQAYPKFIGKIQYAYGAEGEIAMLPVTFTYYNHEFF